MMRSTGFLFSVLIGLGTMACSSDDSSGGGGGSGGSATGGSAGSGASAGAGGTSGSAGSAGSAGAAGASGSSGAPAKTFAALVRGDLAKTNLDDAKKDHDALASAGEAPAKAAGDLGHDVLLGTTLLGTTQNQFMALDEWNNDTNMDAFYADSELPERLRRVVFLAPDPGNLRAPAHLARLGRHQRGQGI